MTRVQLGGCGTDPYLVAQSLESSNEVLCDVLLTAMIQVRFAEIAVIDAIGQYVVGGDQDLVRDRHGGAFVAASRSQSMELVAEVGVARTCRSAGGLDQGGLEQEIALARPRRFRFPGALVVAGADAGPCRRMARTVEDAHV